MKTKIYTIINQKGGVGKSTTAAALASGMNQRGYKVLLVDLDPQGNLSYSLGADTKASNILEVLVEPAKEKPVIQNCGFADVIASNKMLGRAELMIEDMGKDKRLSLALEPIKGNYDYIIIDTPPALSILTINALAASDKIIIPAQADVFSLQGIGQLAENIDSVRTYSNPNLTVEGIVLTRYNQRMIITRDLTEEMKITAEKLGTKVFESKIRECTAVKESQFLRESIFDYAPKSNAAADYKSLLTEILESEV